MKKIVKKIIAFAAVIYIIPAQTNAQCTASVTGDSCVSTLLTAGFSAVPDTVQWYKDGVLQQIRVKRNPYFVTVAGTDNSLFEPRDMCLDAAGNMYIVDGVLYGVVKYAAGSSQGVIVAGGNGKGTALNQFFAPQGIAIDADGNLFVSDDLMNRVTKWAPGATSGVVVAGGNGSGSAANQLNGPQNICLDAANNIYIADRWNNRIQKWAPGATTGITVAGGSQLAEPLDVGVDDTGNVYVADYWNNRILKWVPGAVTGVVVAGGNGSGSNPGQFNFTTALSVSPNGIVYVRDQANYRIQKWAPGSTQGITVAGGNGPGGAANQLDWGFGLFVDNQENIYAPELFLDRVDKFLPSTTTDMQFAANAIGKYSAFVKGETGCSAQSPLFNVTTVPAQPSTIKGPGLVSVQQQGIIYHVTKVKGLSYNWTVPADATIVNGQGTYAIKVNWGFSNGLVTATAINGCGPSALRKKQVKIMQPLSMSAIQSENSNTAVVVFPNPASKVLYLKMSNAITPNKYYITDLAGKVFTCRWMGENSLDISQLATGIYFLHIVSADKTYTTKFVKG
jgi:PKD-like domain/Secretion system C-terminal sorting domain/NHL repeat